jgi:hypothetical protein
VPPQDALVEWKHFSPTRRALARNCAAERVDLTLQLLFLKASESMGNHDSEVVGACSVD